MNPLSDRSIIIALDAKVNGLQAGLRTAQNAVRDYGNRVGEFTRKHRQDMETVGQSGLVMGGAMVTGVGMAAKAAMDWESAWAGVTKTVDGSPEQLADIEMGLRDLAKTLPATHTEIAAVAEAAGALGVEADSIVDFTETMINLGETTNLSADEAATSIAQMMNVMQTAPDDVDNLGSALVALGNNGASTESEILSMAQRLAGMGQLVGASESDILAMANAMASVGISAEMGGGAMSRVMQDIYGAVQEGGEAVQGFADVAGVSAQEFSRAFKSDPVEAANMFVGGLERIKNEGGNVIGTLSDLGIRSTEETRVLLSLAGASDLLSDSLALGEKAWQENSALAAEAAKRYETTEAKIAVAWNNIKDAAIDAGETILPMIGALADGVSDLAQWFTDLPGPVKSAMTMIAGVGGVATVAAGGVLLLAPRIFDTIDGFRNLSKSAPRATGALKGFGKAAGVAALAVTGLQVVGQLVTDEQVLNVEEATQALIALSETGDRSGLDDLFSNWSTLPWSDINSDINSIGDAVERVTNPEWDDGMNRWADGLNEFVGIAKTDIGQTTDRIKEFGEVLGQTAAGGNMDAAVAGFKELAGAYRDNGQSAQDALNAVPGYRDALKGMASDAGVSLSKQQLLNFAMGEVPAAMLPAASATGELEGALADAGVSAEGAVVAMDKLLEQMFAAGMITLSTREAMRQYEASLDDLTASIEANGTTLDTNTEKGRANQAAFDGIAQAGMDAATAMAENGASQEKVQKHLQGTYKDLISAAGQFGITGDKAKAMAREVLGIPDGVSIKSWMDSQAQTTAENTKAAMLSLPEGVDIDSFMSDAAYRKAVLTKAGVDNVPNAKNIKSWMADDAFITALKTRAAVLGIPAKDVIDSFMSSAARGEADDTTAAVLGIPPGASVKSFMENDAKVEAWATKAAIDNIPKNVTVTTYNKSLFQRVNLPDLNGSASGSGRPGLAEGGAIYGPGSKTSDTAGLFRLSNGEHVLDAGDVEAMGGQAGVYRFREALHNGNLQPMAAAPTAGGGGATTATLAPEDRMLLRAVAERGVSVKIGNKVVAEANIEGRKALRLNN